MDATLLQRYGIVLALIGAGLVAGATAVALAGRGGAPPPEADVEATPGAPVTPPASLALLLLVALAGAAGILVLLPAALVVRFYGTWQVLVAVLTALAWLAAPLVYAWRVRPF